jgi:hypothetical protein
MDKDAAYFARRAREEREAAMKAEHPTAQQRHIELAEAYDNRVRAIAAEQSRLGFRLVSAA